MVHLILIQQYNRQPLLHLRFDQRNVKRFETLRNMVEEYQIDAVLEIVLYCCHTYAIESHLVQEFVSNELNLPYLGITTDYSSSDSGQLSTRIGAFLEIIR